MVLNCGGTHPTAGRTAHLPETARTDYRRNRTSTNTSVGQSQAGGNSSCGKETKKTTSSASDEGDSPRRTRGEESRFPEGKRTDFDVPEVSSSRGQDHFRKKSGRATRKTSSQKKGPTPRVTRGARGRGGPRMISFQGGGREKSEKSGNGYENKEKERDRPQNKASSPKQHLPERSC